MITLILGGARSGKSRLAEARARQSGLPVTLIATARPDDAEFTARIAHHQANRPGNWTLIEEPLRLAAALRQPSSGPRLIVIDCLTLWISNLLCETEVSIQEQHIADFHAALRACTADIIAVSNETGMGIVPMGSLTRQFVDTCGRLHQQLAQCADRVTLCVAGLPLELKHDNGTRMVE